MPPAWGSALTIHRDVLYGSDGAVTVKVAGPLPTQAQRPAVQAAIEFDGVRAMLAPTWGQWFDPE